MGASISKPRACWGTTNASGAPIAGTLWPTNSIVHISATGQQLGIINSTVPMDNAQALAYCRANHTLYSLAGDMSAVYQNWTGGRMGIFQTTLTGRTAEIAVVANLNSVNPNMTSFGGGLTPNGLCFPYPWAPYIAAAPLWDDGTNYLIAYFDVSGTNLIAAADPLTDNFEVATALAFSNGQIENSDSQIVEPGISSDESGNITLMSGGSFNFVTPPTGWNPSGGGLHFECHSALDYLWSDTGIIDFYGNNLQDINTLSAASFTGSGFGLRDLNANNLASGTIPLSVLPPALVEALKHQEQYVEKKDAEIEDLKARVERLEQALEKERAAQK